MSFCPYCFWSYNCLPWLGITKVEDANSQAPFGTQPLSQTIPDDKEDDDMPALEAAEEEEEGEVDETGVDPKDIEIVMQQVN